MNSLVKKILPMVTGETLKLKYQYLFINFVRSRRKNAKIKSHFLSKQVFRVYFCQQAFLKREVIECLRSNLSLAQFKTLDGESLP